MGNDEQLIQKINYMSQIINDCNNEYWDWSRRIIKPDVQYDPKLVGMRQQADDLFTAGKPNEAKLIHRSMVDYIENPHPIFPKAVPILQLQGGGFFNWYKIFKDDILAREYILQAKLAGYSLHDSFSFLSDNHPNHRNLTYLTPFYWDGNNFHLDRKNPEFWELLENVLIMHKEVGLDFMLQLWMRKDYISYPYRQNVNGVTDFWNPAAMVFHRLYARWVMELYNKVYGNDYLPWIKIMNEVAHGGSGRKYHQIMYFHEMIWDTVLSEFTVLWHVVGDMTGCEGVGGELIEPHLCPKQGTCTRKAWLRVTKLIRRNGRVVKVQVYDAEKDARYRLKREDYPYLKVGDKVLLGRHGDNERRRAEKQSFVGEKHKFSTWEDYEDIIKRMIASSNWIRIYTEDGGGRAENGTYIIGTKHMAGKEQSYFLGKKLGFVHKKTGKQFKQGHFTHEVLHREPDGLWVPISTYERVRPTFERGKKFAEGYWEEVGD